MPNTPIFRLMLIFFVGTIALVFAVRTATNQPQIGRGFAAGDLFSSPTDTMTLEEIDFLPEPGEIDSKETLIRFYERQDKLATIQVEISTAETSVSDLHSLFWIQVIVGLGALIISGWIWALRPKDLACRLFALSGIATLTFTLPAAIYTTRELALPASLFQTLTALNAFGASLFGIAMTVLFVVYPVRLRFWKTGAYGCAAIFGVWTLASIAGLLPTAGDVNVITMFEMICICIAIGCQFFATKGDPIARASLTWLGLSVLIGAGGFIALNAVPLAFGKDATVSQAYAFLFFLVIYLGLAAGLRRFRLFEVGGWAFRLLFYALGAVLLGLLDAALIFVAGLDRAAALGLSLLAVGFLYLPFRDAIWRRFSRTTNIAPDELLKEALHVAFAPSVKEASERWLSILRRLFDPLEVTEVSVTVDQPVIEDNGLALVLPVIAGAPAMRLSHLSGGRALVTPTSRNLAEQLVTLVTQAESSRDAYTRGVLEERRRMAQDLHDDIGARLLSGLYIADEKTKPTFQAALADIRAMVSDMSLETAKIESVMADMRHEASERMAGSGIELEWAGLSIQKTDDRTISYRYQKAIRSTIREVISNILRHASATKVTVDVSLSRSLSLTIKDNGKGMPASALSGEHEGHGLKNIRRRLSEVGGALDISSSTSGTTVRLEIPFSTN